MKCPQCNHNNEEDASNCVNCEFPFITKKDKNPELQQLLEEIDEELGIEDDEDEEEEEIELPGDKSQLLPLRMGTLAELRGIIQGVLDGEVQEEDLLDIINDFQEEVDHHIEEMDQMVFSPQMWEALKNPVKATKKALGLYDGVFSELKLYYSDKDRDHLEKALVLEEEANMFLSHAFNLVRQSMTNLLGF